MRLPEATIALGVALIATAIAWRVASVARARKRLRSLLRSDDPVARIHALELVGERGLRSQSKTLLRMTTNEDNPDVRAALLTAIARTQWEPANHPALVELRAWARARSSDAAPLPTSIAPRPAANAPRVSERRDDRPLRAQRAPARDRSLVERLERMLGEAVLAVRLERADGFVEVDVQLQEEVHCV